jgi:hypothetical protein
MVICSSFVCVSIKDPEQRVPVFNTKPSKKVVFEECSPRLRHSFHIRKPYNIRLNQLKRTAFDCRLFLKERPDVSVYDEKLHLP